MHKIFGIILTLSFVGLTAQAKEKTTLVVVIGGMGTDGATLSPVPTETSIVDAKAIYEALKTEADKKGNKAVGISYDGENAGITCREPRKGIHNVTADCDFFTLLREAAPKNGFSTEVGSVEFTGSISDLIYSALDITNNNSRVGAAIKKVGNLTCTRVVRPGVSAKCVLMDVMVNKMALDQFPPEEQAGIIKFAKKIGL